MTRLLKYIDKILVVLGVIAFLALGALSTSNFHQLDAIAARNPTGGITPAKYEPQPALMPTIETVVWQDARPQTRGREWVYDVFTPPVIYFNRQSGEFTVTPPVVAEQTVARTEEPFEIDLLNVRQEAYRIQLVAFFGNAGTYLATFESADTNDTVSGREGKVFEKEQFKLISFDVRKVTTATRESMPVVETVAVAIIHDERTGRDETLTTRERRMLPRLQGVFRLRTQPPEKRLLREGQSVDVNGHSYLVIQLSLNPQQAVVSRRAPDSLGAADTRTLYPLPDSLAAEMTTPESARNLSFSTR